MLAETAPMVVPSTGSSIAFCLIVLAVLATFVWAVRAAQPTKTIRVAVGCLLGLIVTALIARSGVLEREMFPPPLMLYLMGSLATMVAIAFSRLGTSLVEHTPIAVLVGFQAFRLPLELVLHSWYEQGVLPIQMTYSGHNFDIVTGVISLLAGVYLWRVDEPSHRRARVCVWVVNLVGTALLLTVATIAVLSSPLPIRLYTNDPPVLLALHVPSTWIVPFCVGSALCGHLLVFRWLLGKPPGLSDQTS